MNKKWSIAEENYIRTHVNDFTDEQMAAKLTELTGREVSTLAARKKRQKMGLKKQQGRGYCKLTQDTFYKQL